ncbi:DUF4831 family protein [uncultured Draconibacterium sp.]|uniref:DUF4831 family protein n=1 Tax=uncultured Draconibacterium sp. TaxID=1573823 RepID=UPI002AA79A19|nr:DUF4831 family protein [uncultured Draconibacterium sp.]
MRYLIVIIAVLLVIPTFGQRKKKDDEVGVVPTYVEGIPYTLPRTGIKIHVKAVCEKFVPGPYAAYAEQLLGIKNAKTRATSNWTITDVEMGTFAEPDPEQVHKAWGEVAALLNLTPNGCLAGINAGSMTLPAYAQVASNSGLQKPDFDDGFSFDYLTDRPSYYPGDSTNNFRPTKVSMEQKAAEAAQRILDCRMNQYDMAALMMDGEHPDGKAYEVSMKELKEIEKDYIQLFVGRTTYKKQNYSVDYVPGSTVKSGQVVFRVSDDKGIVPATDLSGKPVMMEFERVEELNQKLSAQTSSENPDAGASGIYFRLPGVATVRLIYEMNELASARLSIAQFGVVAPFPEDFLGGDYAVELHPETGAIKSVQLK